MFVRASRGEFDCVIACYHDQGLIPVKLLAFGTRGQRHDRPADHPHLGRSRHRVRHRRQGRRRSGQHDCRRQARRRDGSRPSRRAHARKHDGAKKAKDGDDKEIDSRPIADNRKAFHDYHILETFEAGIALLGTEVKGIREGQANLRDSYARVEKGEVWLFNVHINPYSHRGYVDHDPKRKRRLLLHKYEIRKLIGKTVEKGLTLVPTQLYFKNGKVKVAIALAKGKQDHDKRETMRRREVDRETRAAVKERVRPDEGADRRRGRPARPGDGGAARRRARGDGVDARRTSI